MSSYKNFQSDNMKYDYKETRTDVTKPDFNPSVASKGAKESATFNNNIQKWKEFISWALFYPDLFLDLITPETGGIRLDLDQRVFLRCFTRFVSIYGVFPRGWSKTFLEVLGCMIVCVFTPDVDVALTAQTKENAASLLEAKYKEIIKFYPLLKDEVVKARFTKDDSEILFTSGARLDTLANQQSSKGQRRKRIQIEESALLNNELFMDALEPIPNIPRRTIGKEAVVNPEELNGQINFFTTSGFRGSDEFERSIKMIDDMAELKGKIVLGSDWQLACGFGRGETKSQILAKKEKSSPTSFAQNYESRWVGSVDNQLVDINKLLNCRTLTEPLSRCSEKHREFILGVDVARSQDSGNNQSSIAVIEIKRNKNGKIIQLLLVNLFTISNTMNFTAQAVEIKKVKKAFDAKIVVIDTNGLGIGLCDELLKESFDPNTGDSLGCWDTINTDSMPEIRGSEKCVYDLKPQSAQSEIVVTFIDMVESGKLRLLVHKLDADYDLRDKENYIENILPFLHTNFLIEEIANLQLKNLPSGKITIQKVVAKYNKDRVSALMYALWYIKTFEDTYSTGDAQDDLAFLAQFAMF